MQSGSPLYFNEWDAISTVNGWNVDALIQEESLDLFNALGAHLVEHDHIDVVGVVHATLTAALEMLALMIEHWQVRDY